MNDSEPMWKRNYDADMFRREEELWFPEEEEEIDENLEYQAYDDDRLYDKLYGEER